MPPEIMGIVNVTPDSFSDGGFYLEHEAAIAHGLKLLQDGATILDIGGESTRPGAAALDVDKELSRVLPVIEGLADAARAAGAALSIDTRNAETMRAALAAGASIVNDVSALTHDPRSIEIVAASGARVVLMHMQGTPETMQLNPDYDDVVQDVHAWLESRIDTAVKAGIERGRIVVDPGIGFGKTVEHNVALLRSLASFQTLAPVMVGLSRKHFIGRLSRDESATHRLGGSIAGALFAAMQGVDILRVHDVAETMQALKIWRALG